MKKTPAKLYAEVRDFQPADIIQYYAEYAELPIEEARARWDEMLKFLVLCVTSEKVHAPSESIDPAWHSFVLHTEQYEVFCLDQLGQFIHHRPMPNPVEQYQNSLEEIFTSFPDSPVRRHLWIRKQDLTDGLLMADCSGGSDCVGQCSEKGCSRVRVERTDRLPSVVAMSAV